LDPNQLSREWAEFWREFNNDEKNAISLIYDFDTLKEDL
jgi:hypothetical protein